MKKHVFFVVVGLSLLSGLPVKAAIYSTDFSTDPGWITDQPEKYYPINGMYHVQPEHQYPGYTPSRYAYKQLPEAVGSFELQWDLEITRCDWSISIPFGLYDSSLTRYQHGPGPQYILGLAGNPDAGHLWALIVTGKDGYAEVPGGGTWDFDTWYTCKLAYNAGTNIASFDVWDTLNGTSKWVASLSVPGGFTNDLINLGTSSSGIGDYGPEPGISPSAVAEGYIDNVNLTPEPATLFLLGLGGLALLRKRRA